MSNRKDGFQHVGESFAHHLRGREAHEGSDDDESFARYTREETVLDAYPQGDLGDGLETP